MSCNFFNFNVLKINKAIIYLKKYIDPVFTTAESTRHNVHLMHA